MASKTQITPATVFQFDSQIDVRMLMIDGTPWFAAVDVCKALALTNSRMAMKALDAEEKGVSLTYTPGGQQRLNVISESGLYTLILRCRDAVTPGTTPYRFRKWVTSEVLPAIRKTGRYNMPAKDDATLADLAGTGRARLPAPTDIAQSMMPAILEAIQSQAKRYHYPKKQGFVEHFHTPTGVLMLTQQSQLMDLLRELEQNGNDVGAPVAELICMCNFITGIGKVLEDIATHAAYIGKQART